jgi:hypothetical protein
MLSRPFTSTATTTVTTKRPATVVATEVECPWSAMQADATMRTRIESLSLANAVGISHTRCGQHQSALQEMYFNRRISN